VQGGERFLLVRIGMEVAVLTIELGKPGGG
jgi:hypothetical protein